MTKTARSAWQLDLSIYGSVLTFEDIHTVLSDCFQCSIASFQYIQCIKFCFESTLKFI